MNNLLVWVCLALVAWPSVSAMYHLGSKAVFQPPASLKNDSYFGYSITYDTQNKQLVISAPTANNFGEVYNCNMSSRACTAITKNISVSRPPNYDHDYWFGATVKAGPNFVLICAPRYTVLDGTYDRYVTRGKCYSQEEGKLEEKRGISSRDIIKDAQSTMEASMDSIGWSSDIATDDTIIVGGPGMYHGRTMIYPQSSLAPNFIRYSKNNMPEFNFGYAVASGLFRKKDRRGRNSILYAISSTYGYGEVSIWLLPNSGNYQFVTRLRKPKDSKTVVGSMFGAVLCAAKLLNSSRSDLLVGAPAYATKTTYNLGAVYVYLYNDNGSPEFKRMIVGQVSGGMFGSAIVSVGDLNGDKNDDIVISAPFENEGRGVVYVYSGANVASKSDKDLKYLQRIEPETSYAESFGMSLTPVSDYDENGCNELAIGSPYKDTVLLLKCIAAVTVMTLKPKFPNLQGRTLAGKENFEFEVCLSVTYRTEAGKTLPHNIIGSIKTTVEMNHVDARLLLPDKNTGRFSFTSNLADKKSEYCKTVPFILPIRGNYETEVIYLISSELLNDPRNLTDFDGSRVILSDFSELKHQGSLWVAECENRTCVPKLNITTFDLSIDDSKPYLIDINKKENMKISVRNYGEVAYESCVRVHIKGVSVRQAGGCEYEPSTDGDRLKCKPPMPLRQNEEWVTGEIQLQTYLLTNLDETINITLYLHDHCNVDVDPTMSKTISLKADGGIIIKGETDIGDIVKMKEEEIKEKGKMMQHIYTIFNHGVTTWMDVPFYVTLEEYPYIEYQNVTIYYFSSETSSGTSYTECVLQNGTSMIYLCKLKSLMTTVTFGKIIIPMYILPETLDGLVDKDKNVTVMSSVKLHFAGQDYADESITTTIALEEATVPIDTIIIAVFVGLCILIIIALILYRIGFLRRKKREELQKLQKSVKRQTILRRSTMPSQSRAASSAPTEDRKQILEEEEEDEPTPSSQ